MLNVRSCLYYFDIVGGENVFATKNLMVTKIFENIARHYSLAFKIQIFKFITTTFFNPIKIFLDGIQIIKLTNENFGEPTENFCGKSTKIIFFSCNFYFKFKKKS